MQNGPTRPSSASLILRRRPPRYLVATNRTSRYAFTARATDESLQLTYESARLECWTAMTMLHRPRLAQRHNGTRVWSGISRHSDHSHCADATYINCINWDTTTDLFRACWSRTWPSERKGQYNKFVERNVATVMKTRKSSTHLNMSIRAKVKDLSWSFERRIRTRYHTHTNARIVNMRKSCKETV